MTVGLWFLVACAALMLVLVGAGVLAVLPRLKSVQKRTAAYGDLPILAQIERTRERVEQTRANLEQLPILMARARAAIAALRAQFEGAVTTVAQAVRVVRDIGVAVRIVARALGR